MKIKKIPFLLSFALATVVVVGQVGFAKGSDTEMDHMMDGNGMMNMMSDDGMMRMMESMNTPEGQKLMKACSDFMESYEDE